jgi:hypothetical protein
MTLTSYKWLLLVLINLSGLAISLLAILRPLYYAKATNCARFSSFGSILFTFIMCFAVELIHDDGMLTYAHLVFLPVCGVVGSVMMTIRLDRLKQDSIHKLQAKNVCY